jgi:hypothetical protein
LVALALAGPALAAPACPMHQVASLPNRDAKSGQTPLWRSADTHGAPIFFVVGFHTNTDGARHSYSVLDPWGEKTAFNNLCNAMHGSCAELPKDGKARPARMAAVLAAYKAGWPADQLAATRLASNVIPFRDGKPCPLIDNEFLVSATALQAPKIKDVCDLANYADSSTVPGIVVPKGVTELSKRGVQVGDLVAVLRPSASAPVFGVVSDTGDNGKLGEAGMAMNQALLHLPPPTNYTTIKAGWDVPAAFVIIFPGTRDAKAPYLQPARIATAAKAALGGLEPTLAACGTAYGPAPQAR